MAALLLPQQDLASLSGYLWLALAVLALAVLITLFAWVLVQRHRAWLGERFLKLDAFLLHHLPRAWGFTRQRFSREAWHGLTLTLAFGIFVGMIALFMLITESWRDEEVLYRIDRLVNSAIQNALSDEMIRAVAAFTDLGGTELAAPIAILLALVLLVRKERWWLAALFMTVGVGSGVMWSLKLLFARARPVGLLSTPASASFPSGHTFTAVVLYGFLIFLVWRWTKSPAWRLPLTILLVLVILGVGLSRVLLSVHWVTDVLGGFTIGLAWLVFGIIFIRAVQAYVMQDAQNAV